jgi:hypothetical protein
MLSALSLLKERSEVDGTHQVLLYAYVLTTQQIHKNNKENTEISLYASKEDDLQRNPSIPSCLIARLQNRIIM